MEKWGFWDWVGFGALGLAAFIEAANAALAGAPKLTQALPILTGGIVPFLPLMFFVVGALVLILRALGVLHGKNATRGHAEESKPKFLAWPEPYAPISVVGMHFRNEKVLLDGHAFDHCTFENVTFVYNGTTAPSIRNSKFMGLQFSSDNPAVVGAFTLMYASNLLNERFKLEMGAKDFIVPATWVELSKQGSNP